MLTRPRIAALTLACTLTLAGLAHAESMNPETRRATYQQARAAQRDARFAEAERLFLKLWTDAPTYDVAFNLAEIEMVQKRYREAAEHLTFGLSHFAPREDAKVAQAFRNDLVEAKRHIATVRIAVNRPGATVLVDGRAVGTAPLKQAVFLDPGAYVLEAQLDGAVAAKQAIDAKAGAEYSVSLELADAAGEMSTASAATAAPLGTGAPPPPAGAAHGVSSTNAVLPPSAPPPLPERSAVPAIVALSGAGVGLLAGIGFTIASNNAAGRRDDLKEQRAEGRYRCSPQGNPTPEVCDDLRDEANATVQYRTVAIAGFSAAVLGGVAAYLLYPRGSSDSLRVGVVPSSTGFYAGMSGRF